MVELEAAGGRRESWGGSVCEAVMQGLCLLLVMTGGVVAFSGNGTLEEVQVSSQPLRVSVSVGYPGHDAEVRPFPRMVGGEIDEEEAGRSEEEIHDGSTGIKRRRKANFNEKIGRVTRGRDVKNGRLKARTKRDVNGSGTSVGSSEEKQEGSGLIEQGRSKDEVKTGVNEDRTVGTKNDVKGYEETVMSERYWGEGGLIGGGRSSDEGEGRGHMKKMKKTLKKIMPYLLVPGMMAIGYAPFILASLKMFVMNAVMINMMAFNAAIFITLRNMVFGPRVGQHVKYYNFGYSHRKKHHHH